ncbi:LmeA family phospholipid-binding protein [Rubrivirga marina]|uniref:DUF2993 domain-containing protein n=1 Tax=Rubrivirga marina TaxID=1196024 RepID=A0A271IX68_9BACT|nr:DUF2993 domain-containing protein [Rubrivirga marina]PAP75315.1 hypothetical protein BSZ37_02080 [Rubrivirga marina]
MRTLPLFITLATLSLTGCDVSGRVEAEIEAALPAALGPAARYDAEVEGLALRDASAETVRVVGERVAREDAPVIDRLDVELRGVTFDRSERRLTRVDGARATARLLPADLAAYLGTQRGIADADVVLAAPDRASIRVRGEFEGLRIPVGAEVRGRLAASDGRVRLDVESVRAAGIGLGGTIARRVDQQINPVVDLTDEDLELRVTDVRVEGGALVVEATGDLTGLSLRRR